MMDVRPGPATAFGVGRKPGTTTSSFFAVTDTNTERSSLTPRHMPQLDSLRTFAVLAVMIHHFWAEATFGLPLGFVGVQLFFVLSGFLITTILWPAREAVQARRQSAWAAFRRFYIRRFLRIFPLFYVALGVLFILGVPEV